MKFIIAIVALSLPVFLSACGHREDRVILAAPYYSVPQYREFYTNGRGELYIRKCC